MGSSHSPGNSSDNDNRYALDASYCVGRTKVDANDGSWNPVQSSLDVERTPRTLPGSCEQDGIFAYRPLELYCEDYFSSVPEAAPYDITGLSTLWEELPDMKDLRDLMHGDGPDLADQQLSPQIHTRQLADQESSITGGSNRRRACNQCWLVFPTGKELEAHAKATKHRLYACPVVGCGKKYWRRDVLQRHTAVHREVWQWPCKLCPMVGDSRSFTRKDRLVQHLRTQHGLKEAESFLEAVPSRKKKSASNVCSDIDHQTPSGNADERSLELRQSMQDIHRWLSNRLVTSDPDGKKTEPTLSTSCANAFIKDLATAIKQECNV